MKNIFKIMVLSLGIITSHQTMPFLYSNSLSNTSSYIMGMCLGTVSYAVLRFTCPDWVAKNIDKRLIDFYQARQQVEQPKTDEQSNMIELQTITPSQSTVESSEVAQPVVPTMQANTSVNTGYNKAMMGGVAVLAVAGYYAYIHRQALCAKAYAGYQKVHGYASSTLKACKNKLTK